MLKKILFSVLALIGGVAQGKAELYRLIEPETDRLGCWEKHYPAYDEVLGYSVLGHVFIRSTSSNEYAVLHPLKSAAKSYGTFQNLKNFQREVLDEPGFIEHVLRPDHVAKIRVRLGPLKKNEIYIPVPYPFLGGSGEPQTYDKGNLWVFMAIISEMQGLCK